MVREINMQNLPAVISAALKKHCRNTFDMNIAHIAALKCRFRKKGLFFRKKGLNAADAVILICRIDDDHGKFLAKILRPGYSWQALRDRGEFPLLLETINRNCFEEALDSLDKEAAEKLRRIRGIAAVVVNFNVFEVFEV